jgi:hypothetical protein
MLPVGRIDEDVQTLGEDATPLCYMYFVCIGYFTVVVTCCVDVVMCAAV